MSFPPFRRYLFGVRRVARSPPLTYPLFLPLTFWYRYVARPPHLSNAHLSFPPLSIQLQVRCTFSPLLDTDIPFQPLTVGLQMRCTLSISQMRIPHFHRYLSAYRWVRRTLFTL